jgi:geranylgeranyl pyrophosphate synthase
LISSQQIQTLIATIPEAASWPEIMYAFSHPAKEFNVDWNLPVMACRAVGGTEAEALPGAAAVACLYLSIILVDDMLDDEPDGLFRDIGSGRTANLALGLQALALQLIDQAPVSVTQKLAVEQRLSWLGLATAQGQQLDAANLMGEESYWRTIRAKSTPFYATTLEIGALLGGAPQETVEALRQNGYWLGEVVQLEDDLQDALATPANADWEQGRNNLLILYASTTDHPQREAFAHFRTRYQDPTALNAAQSILYSSGAVSYVIYHIIQRYQQAKQQLLQMNLAMPDDLIELWENYPRGIKKLFDDLGLDYDSSTLFA